MFMGVGNCGLCGLGQALAARVHSCQIFVLISVETWESTGKFTDMNTSLVRSPPVKKPCSPAKDEWSEQTPSCTAGTSMHPWLPWLDVGGGCDTGNAVGCWGTATGWSSWTPLGCRPGCWSDGSKCLVTSVVTQATSCLRSSEGITTLAALPWGTLFITFTAASLLVGPVLAVSLPEGPGTAPSGAAEPTRLARCTGVVIMASRAWDEERFCRCKRLGGI